MLVSIIFGHVLYLDLSSSSDHHLLHSCLGTGMRFGTQNKFCHYRASLVHSWKQFYDIVISGTDYLDLRNLDNFCSVCVGKHVKVTRYCWYCARL